MKKTYANRIAVTAIMAISIALGSSQVNAATDLSLATESAEMLYEHYKETKLLAMQGDTTAQFNLGSIYALGEGVPQSYDNAFTWYEKAAKKGNVHSQHNIALMYEKGKGAPQDSQMAMKWYQLAAAQGYADSLLNIGVLYVKGIGVDKDTDKALEFFKKSAELGNTKAKYNLGLIYAQKYNIK